MKSMRIAIALFLACSALNAIEWKSILNRCLDKGYWDINGDGEIDCVDKAIIYASELRKAYPGIVIMLIEGHNYREDWHHMYVRIYTNEEGERYIEPGIGSGILDPVYEASDTKTYEARSKLWQPYMY